jgi:hypothetical protein
MNNELQLIRKETMVAEELRIVRVPVEIRTEHLPNTSLECYRYAHLLGTL